MSTESEQNAGQGYPPTWQLREYGIPVSLSMDTSVWWSGDLFAAMRSTLNADRSPRAPGGPRSAETMTTTPLRAEQVVEWATMGGAEALGLDDLVGSIEVGKRADLVLHRNDRSPVMSPLLNPYGHVVFQAGRGDVHTVLVDGRVLKRDHELVGVDLPAARDAVGRTVEYLRSTLGEEAWTQGMNPEVQPGEIFDNPYQYTDWDSRYAVWKRD